MRWKRIDSGENFAQKNMDLDAYLLKYLQDEPILHFYDWKGDSATYGYFVDVSKYLNLNKVKSNRLHLGKRPTGGGIVFHIWDLAFSVLIPASHEHFSERPLENYAFIHDAVLEAIKSFKKEGELIVQDAHALDDSCVSFCMARPTKYDVVLGGRKVAGAAQRKTKKGFLHQGTISLKMPSFEYLSEVLLPGTKVLEAMKASTFALLDSDEDLEEGRCALKEALTQQFIHYVKT